MPKQRVSIVIPVYNEANGLAPLVKEIASVMKRTSVVWDLIFIDDGSTDGSLKVLKKLAKANANVTLVVLARNFGKEIALTAGLHESTSDAVIMMDSDLQHPPKYIPEMLKRWNNGADVVIGVRKEDGERSAFKKFGSITFNWLMNLVSEVKFVPGATDFRLIDRVVVTEFTRFTERSRITRGLIDWLGFEREYIYFKADERHSGERSYSYVALARLATDSLISLSQVPLRLSGYLGFIIVVLAGPAGVFMLLDKYYLSNQFDFTPTAALSVLLMFMVGVVLINLGLIALYIATIHREVTNRPLYVVKRQRH